MTDETGGVDPMHDDRRERASWAPPGGPPSAPVTPLPEGPSLEERLRRATDRLGIGPVELPFETPVEAVRWWFRPVIDPRTRRSLGAAFAMSLIGPVCFAIAVAVFAATFALSFVIVGLALVVPAFAAIGACASVGRRIAGWATGTPIAPRPLALAESATTGVLAPIRTRLTDSTRWRHLAFVLLDVAVAPLFLAATIIPIVFVLGSVAGFEIDDVIDGDAPRVLLAIVSPEFLFAVTAVGVVARLVRFTAVVRSRYVTAMIGPDRETALVERVEELSVQRDQVLDAVASERRRIERNLHDGVQQQLVALGIDVGRARNKLTDDPDTARELLDDAHAKVRSAIGELRLIGRGLHPAVLDDRGLDAALSAVVANAPIPIAVEVIPFVDGDGERVELPGELAETGYYIANEAITNVLKYAEARVASIRVEPDVGLLPALRVTVHDDGRGGADERRGSGIAGMRARVEAVDGAFRIDSPPGGPTIVTAVIPIRRTRLDADVIGFGGTDTSGANRG